MMHAATIRGICAFVFSICACLLSAAAHADQDGSWAIPLAVRFDVVIFGETHGNAQSPEAFIDLVDAAVSQHAGPVLVGLELPPDAIEAAQHAADQMHAGEDGIGGLRQSAFWSEAKDGRTSRAQFALIQALRLRERKGDVQLVGFDMRVTGREHFGETASAAITAQAAGGQKIMLLTGNGHAMLEPSPGSVAWPLAKRGYSVSIINAVHSGGESWVCVGGVCGPRLISAALHCPQQPELRQIEVGGLTATQGDLCIGRLTASPPVMAHE